MPAVVVRAASGSAFADRPEALRSGPEASALPAAELSSPATARLGLMDSWSGRPPASARSDLDVEASPVTEMPDLLATEPAGLGSESVEPAVREFAVQE